jgi:hypothetical protein
MVIAANVSADTRAVLDDRTLDALREELTNLEAAETRVSAERRRLQQQIDSGFASESTRARERDVSDERRDLHQRIDALQVLLGLERTAEVLARKRAAPVRELEPEQEVERPTYLTLG